MKWFLSVLLIAFMYSPAVIAAPGNSGAVVSSSTSPALSLKGTWKINLDDKPDFAGPRYDDGSWDTIQLPGSMISYSISRGRGYSGVLWIRKSIYIEKNSAGEAMGLSLGRIGNADETYFNGVMVGSTGGFPPEEHSMWHFSRHYMVPSRLIKPGEENVVAVRISYFCYGELLGNPQLLPYGEWKRNANMTFFLRTIMTYFVIAMGTTLFIIFAIFYLRRPGETVYFYYALQLVVGFFVVFELCSYWRIFPTTLMRFQVLIISWVALNVAHPVFLHRFYDLKRTRIERTLWIYLAAVICIAVFYVNRENVNLFNVAVGTLTMSVGFYNISCHISALYKKKPYARMFSVFGIAVVLGALHDGVAYLGKGYHVDFHIGPYHFNDMYFHYSAMALYTGIALVLVSRSIDMTKKIEELNVNLEASVEERTRQLVDTMGELENKNRMLSEMALRDGLTGLYNHIAIHDRLAEVLNEAKRIGFPLCLMMLDLDDFKTINDRYGHQLGDLVLIRVAQAMKTGLTETDTTDTGAESREIESVIRSYDITGRYGGDEFIIGLINCTEEKALLIANRLRSSFEKIHFNEFPDVKVRGSFGIAVLGPKHQCRAIKDLVTLADMALYKSKTSGKNRITLLHFTENGTYDNGRV